jgi:hypothetical protein
MRLERGGEEEEEKDKKRRMRQCQIRCSWVGRGTDRCQVCKPTGDLMGRAGASVGKGSWRLGPG